MLGSPLLEDSVHYFADPPPCTRRHCALRDDHLVVVKVASDLRDAKVYISVMDGGETREQIIEALNHASGYIQKILARRVRLKYTPRLTFHVDDSIERGFRINTILKDLAT